jgi:hypothetical protein
MRAPLAASLLFVLLGAAACTPPPDHEPGELPLLVDPDPPRDAELSPYTGWTRAHHVALFARTLSGFVDHLSEGGARTTFSGSPLDTPGAIEGVTRMLQATGYWLANPDNPQVISYRERELDVLDIARTALVNGTDPAHEDYWGPIETGSQRVIEADFVAQFLLDTRARFWDTLDDDERDQIMDWLAPTDDSYKNNWTGAAFQRNLARKLLGYPVDLDAMQAQLDYVYDLYVGDGWYEDGPGDRFDYYNAFMLHYDLLTWARYDGDSDPQRRDEVRARAIAFVHHFPYFFDEGGAQVFFGRSLGYRAAVTTTLQAVEIDGISPLPPGAARRLVSANLAGFVGDDLLGTQWMFDEADAIRSGYFAADPGVLEGYQHEGSQYFFTRAFAALRLSEDHPYWSATEQPLPADEGAFIHAIPAPGFVLSHEPGQGHVVMLTTRSDKQGLAHVDQYRRLQYSSRFYFQRGFEPPFPYDGLVTASREGQFSTTRSDRLDGAAGPGLAYLRYEVVPELTVYYSLHHISTLSFWVRGGVLRLACLDPWWGEPTHLHEGGFALPSPAEAALLDWSGPAMVAGSPSGTTILAGLFGYADVELDFGVSESLRYNSIHPAGTYVALITPEPSAGSSCAGSFQLASRGSVDHDPLAALVASASASATGDADEQQWSLTLDDGTQVWANLSAVPHELAVELGPLTFEGPLRAALVSADGAHWRALGGRRIARAVDDATVVELDAILDALPQLGAAWTEDIGGTITVELGAPASVTLPEGWTDGRVEVIGLGGVASAVGDDLDGVYELDAAGFDAAATELELSLATLRLSPL